MGAGLEGGVGNAVDRGFAVDRDGDQRFGGRAIGDLLVGEPGKFMVG